MKRRTQSCANDEASASPWLRSLCPSETVSGRFFFSSLPAALLPGPDRSLFLFALAVQRQKLDRLHSRNLEPVSEPIRPLSLLALAAQRQKLDCLHPRNLEPVPEPIRPLSPPALAAPPAPAPDLPDQRMYTRAAPCAAQRRISCAHLY